MNKQGRLQLDTRIEHWPMKAPFSITGHTWTQLSAFVVTVREGEIEGRGEASGVYYHDDLPSGMPAQIESIRNAIEVGADRSALRELLPAGGARNALDCALWDLEARRLGKPVWQLAGVGRPVPLLTTCTVGADAPHAMAAGARAYVNARAVKLKLTGEESDAERVRAVRAARPDVWLGVDANQGFTRQGLERLLPALVECGVSLIEQPFPVGREADLDGLSSPIAIAADESVQTLEDIATLPGRFDVANIKLDKCGGLTEGLLMAYAARKLGLGVMVGCMMGTSRAMAPAFILGQLCDIVDLDGPLLLQHDVSPGASYEDGYITCPQALWGSARVEALSSLA